MPGQLAANMTPSGRLMEMAYAGSRLGLGHCITPDADSIPVGCSVRTYDCNLDTAGIVTQRGGALFLSENGACGQLIDDFQSGGWDGSSAADAAQFRAFDYKGPGTEARRLTMGSSGTLSSNKSVAMNLGSDTDEYICWWAYINDVTKITSIYLAFITTGPFVDVNYHQIAAASLVTGWNFIKKRKSEATVVGAPSWGNITELQISVATNAATFVTFDNAWLGPANIYGLYNFRRSAARGGGNWIFAYGRDSLCVHIPAEQRWRFLRGERGACQAATAATMTLALTASDVDDYYKNQALTVETGTGFGQTAVITGYVGATKVASFAALGTTPAAGDQYVIGALGKALKGSFAVLNDHLYFFNGYDRPKVMLDNLRAYDAGIDKPTTIPSMTQGTPGGPLSATPHIYAVSFYSNITVSESDPLFFGSITTIMSSRIDLSNLPVSLDPKVTHLRIYRLDQGQPGYKSVSGNVYGEVANGVTTYTDSTTTSALGAILERGTAGYDLRGIPPNARIGVAAASRLVVDDPSYPGRLWVSSVNNGEEFPLDGQIPLDSADNNDITSLLYAYKQLIAWKGNGVYSGGASGSALQPFVMDQRSPRHGSVGAGSPILTEAGIFWRAGTGFYRMGPEMRPQDVSRGWIRTGIVPFAGPSVEDLDPGRAWLISSAYLPARRQIMWSETMLGGIYPNVQPILHEDLIGSLSSSRAKSPYTGGWAFHRVPVSIVAEALDEGTNVQRVIGMGEAGILYFLDQNRASDTMVAGNAAIDMHYVTPPLSQLERPYSLGPSVLKFYRRIDMIIRPFGLWPLDLEAYFDWSVGDSQASHAGFLSSATSTTVTFRSSESGIDSNNTSVVSTANDAYHLKWVVMVSGVGAGQARRIKTYNGATRTAILDRPWTITPATNDDYAIISRTWATGQLTPSAVAGAGIGSTFAVGLSGIGPAGGNFQRVGLPPGRHRSLQLSFRNPRLEEAPALSSFSIWAVRMRASGRLS